MSFLGRNIGVVAPSGMFQLDKLEQGCALLRSWGYHTIFSPHLHERHLFSAGTPKQRAADIEWACQNQDVDIIWYARGGYGTIQILPLLTQSITKPVLGFSDATALGVHLSNQKSELFYHAPVIHSLSYLCDEATKEALRSFLSTGILPSLAISPIQNTNHAPIKARVVGGNLCVLSTALGTPYQIQAQNTILLLEDIGEPAYKIHRMLTQMRLGGIFDSVQAIVFGTFTDCPSTKEYTILDTILDALDGINIPIYANAPFGHGTENLLWNAGTTYTLHNGMLYVE